MVVFCDLVTSLEQPAAYVTTQPAVPIHAYYTGMSKICGQ